MVHPERRLAAKKKTAARQARTAKAKPAPFAAKETSTMHFSPPADLFGEQGLIVLIVVALVLFGSTQIPKLARSLGSAQKEFKKGLDDGSSTADPGTATVVEAVAPTKVIAPAPTAVTVESAAPPENAAR
jgi:sec-independent protein translocase protein TatA